MGAQKMIEIPNARWIADDVLSGGQPTAEQLIEAAEAGYRTVINLRGVGEEGSIENEREQVEALGMQYVAIPIGSPDAFNLENVKRLMTSLEATDSPTMLHCASGNRIGILFALKAFWVDGSDGRAAVETGRAKGMRHLPKNVSAILGVDPQH